MVFTYLGSLWWFHNPPLPLTGSSLSSHFYTVFCIWPMTSSASSGLRLWCRKHPLHSPSPLYSMQFQPHQRLLIKSKYTGKCLGKHTEPRTNAAIVNDLIKSAFWSSYQLKFYIIFLLLIHTKNQLNRTSSAKSSDSEKGQCALKLAVCIWFKSTNTLLHPCLISGQGSSHCWAEFWR